MILWISRCVLNSPKPNPGSPLISQLFVPLVENSQFIIHAFIPVGGDDEKDSEMKNVPHFASIVRDPSS